jgi:hypothetical protein
MKYYNHIKYLAVIDGQHFFSDHKSWVETFIETKSGISRGDWTEVKSGDETFEIDEVLTNDVSYDIMVYGKTLATLITRFTCE